MFPRQREYIGAIRITASTTYLSNLMRTYEVFVCTSLASVFPALQNPANKSLQCDNNNSVWVRFSIFGISSGNSVALLLDFLEDGCVETPSVHPDVTESGVAVVETCCDSATVDLDLMFLGVGTLAPFHLPRLAIPQNRYRSGYPPHSKPFEMHR